MSKLSSPGLTTFPQTSQPPPRLDLDAVLGCEYGRYPWDGWHRWALAQGLGEDLAGSGRLLIREAFNHTWEPWLRNLCGWSDDGQALLALALRSPATAHRQWDILMRTDGLRGDYRSRSTEWVWGYLKSDARRLQATLERRSL